MTDSEPSEENGVQQFQESLFANFVQNYTKFTNDLDKIRNDSLVITNLVNLMADHDLLDLHNKFVSACDDYCEQTEIVMIDNDEANSYDLLNDFYVEFPFAHIVAIFSDITTLMKTKMESEGGNMAVEQLQQHLLELLPELNIDQFEYVNNEIYAMLNIYDVIGSYINSLNYFFEVTLDSSARLVLGDYKGRFEFDDVDDSFTIDEREQIESFFNLVAQKILKPKAN